MRNKKILITTAVILAAFFIFGKAQASMSNLTCGFSGQTVGTLLQPGDTIATFEVSQDYGPAYFVSFDFPTGTVIGSNTASSSDFVFEQDGSSHSPDIIGIYDNRINMQIHPFTLYAGSTITVKLSATAAGDEIWFPITATTSGSFNVAFYDGEQNLSDVVLAPDDPTQIGISTSADSSGEDVSDQTLVAGSSLTVYSNTYDQYGNFVANVAADSWSLDEKTGDISDDDLAAAGDSKSATLTGNLEGSAMIVATKDGFTSAQSGAITVEQYYAGGHGTEEEPYLITNCTEFANINYYPEAFFSLITNIDCGNRSSSIVEEFKGHFDGNGNTIFASISSAGDNVALFGSTSGATITDLHVRGSMTGNQYVGGIIGYASNTEIYRVFNSVSISALEQGGGIAGFADDTEIYDSYNEGSITMRSSGQYAGGIVGYLYSGIISRCYNQGIISDGIYMGGIIGQVEEESSVISDCFNVGNINSQASNPHLGGIYGYDPNASEESDGAEFSNDFFDKSRTGFWQCGNDLDGAIAVPGICGSVNSTWNENNYFKNNSSSRPFVDAESNEVWDFSGEDSVWQTVENGYPNLRSILDDGEATTNDVPVLSDVPEVLEGEDKTDTSIPIEWSESAPANIFSVVTGYIIKYKISETENDWTTINIYSTDTSYTIEDLTPRTSYDFKVSAVNIAGESDYSEVVAISTLGAQGETYSISTCEDLQNMNDDLAGNYTLTQDIDCSDTVNWNLSELQIGVTLASHDPRGMVWLLGNTHVKADTVQVYADENLLDDSYYDLDAEAGTIDFTKSGGAPGIYTADFSYYQGFQPIGSFIDFDEEDAFAGHFDGDGHTINNLFIDRTGESGFFIGLFGIIGEEGEIENVKLENADITAQAVAGGIAAYILGGTISNSSVTGDVATIG